MRMTEVFEMFCQHCLRRFESVSVEGALELVTEHEAKKHGDTKPHGQN